jgi:hypothetical protein
MIVNIHFTNYERKLKYDIDESIKMIEIKELLEKEENMPFNKNEIKLIFSGRVLNNDKTLKDIKFVSGNTIAALGRKETSTVIVPPEITINPPTPINQPAQTNNMISQLISTTDIDSLITDEDYENINNELVKNYYDKFAFILKSIIDYDTFCNFIRNKENILNIILDVENPTNEQFKDYCRGYLSAINLLKSLNTYVLLYVILLPTITKYKEHNSNLSNDQIISNLINLMDEWINEYNQTNPPIQFIQPNNPIENFLSILETVLIPNINNVSNGQNSTVYQESLEQMKNLGLTNERKCKMCLTMCGGDVELAVNMYYEVDDDEIETDEDDDEIETDAEDF